MVLQYNVHYEVASAAFLAILYLFLKLQYNSDTKINRVFQFLVLSVFVADILDILSAIVISYGTVLPRWINWLVNTLYFSSDALLGLKFEEYTYRYTHRKQKEHNTYLIVNEIIFVIYIFIMVGNLFSGFIFNVDSAGVYSHGNLYLLVYVIPYYYYFCSAVALANNFPEFDIKQRLSVLVYVFVGLIGGFLQMIVFPNVLLSVFSVALGIVMMFFSMETPDYQKLIVAMGELERARKEADLAKENALAANKAKSVFLASMSHEIRTPINSILGMDEILLRSKLNEEQEEYARNIEKSGKSLLSIINDILDFSKIESGKMNVVAVEYEVGTLLEDCVNLIFAKGREKGLEMSVHNAADLPSILYGDEVRVRQIIVNLLSNAVKYTNDGFVSLKVDWEQGQTDEMILKIAVSDSGIGISKEAQENLFDSFMRFDEQINRNIEGSGLGLAITSQLLELMGGTIRVESKKGVGSTFFVEIPQKIISKEAMGNFSGKGNNRKRGKYKPSFIAEQVKILVVDDVKVNLQVVKGLLKETLIQIDAVESGMNALECAREKKYDLILMDHMMPEMDGIETLKAIRNSAEKNVDTPMIALTANAISGAREMYIKEGFVDYLSKPMSGEALEKMILKYIPSIENSAGKASNEEKIQTETMEERGGSGMDFTEIDKEVGLSYCGDDEDLYQDIVGIYLEEYNKDQIEAALASGDMKNYRVLVHALKSTSLNIGAVKLSEAAKALEAAVIDENMEYIKANHPVVMAGYEALANKLK